MKRGLWKESCDVVTCVFVETWGRLCDVLVDQRTLENLSPSKVKQFCYV